MLRVLHVIPHLEYSGAARQLQLLATGLPRHQFEVRVCALGPLGPVAEALQSAGIALDALGWNRPFDLNPFRSLRRVVAAFSPSVIHTWRWSSLRAILLAAGRKRKIVASALEQPQQPGKIRNWLDQRLLCRVDQAIANDAAGAEQLQQSGLVSGRINVIPPGVAPASPVNSLALAFRQSLGLSADSRLLFCVGPLEPHKGFRDAVWTVDILRYLYDSLHLVLIGGGSDRPRLEQFVRNTGGSDKSHFAGWKADVPALLSMAEVIWLPSQKRGGVNVALEAMAAGRPVVASRLPSLAEVIADGETGLLVPPGDKIEMARQTRLLLDNPERRRLMGAAGQRRAQTHFSVANMVKRFAWVYELVSG